MNTGGRAKKRSKYQKYPLIFAFSLVVVSCSAPVNSGSCTASVSSQKNLWYAKEQYTGFGGVLDMERFTGPYAALQAKAKPSRKSCTAQFLWDGNELLSFTRVNCIEYAQTINLSARIFFGKGYATVPLLNSKVTNVQNYLKEARAISTAEFWQVGNAEYLNPMNSASLARQTVTKKESATLCYSGSEFKSAKFGCVSPLGMRVERYQIDEAKLTAQNRSFIQKHQAVMAAMRAKEVPEVLANWLEFTAKHEELTQLAASSSKAKILLDLSKCASPEAASDVFVKNLCSNQEQILPVIKKHLLIDDKTVWEVADALVADGSIAAPEVLKSYFDAKFAVSLKELQPLYDSLLKYGAENPKALQVQSNFYTNNKADQAAFAFLAVSKTNPVIKGFDWKIENGQIQSSLNTKISVNLNSCLAMGSTISIGKTLPLAVITRNRCDESFSNSALSLPSYDESAEDKVNEKVPPKTDGSDTGGKARKEPLPSAPIGSGTQETKDPRPGNDQKNTVGEPKETKPDTSQKAQSKTVATNETKQSPEPTEAEVASSGVNTVGCK